jgi:hypothetical protein
VAVTVPVALRALAGEALARAAVPFLVLLPGAVWLAVSADAVFTAVTAAGVAALALGAVRPLWTGAAWALLGGALLGLGAFLSYGLVLMAALALAVALAAGRWRWLPAALAGAGGVWLVVAAFGFSWLDGYHLVVGRYHQGIGAVRPYSYWVWANLASLLLATGPVAAPVLRRVAVRVRHGFPAWSDALVALPAAAAVAVALADVSGLSKGETERIWLPFAVWLVAGAALLPAPARRGWLAAQAVLAIVVNHLVATVW